MRRRRRGRQDPQTKAAHTTAPRTQRKARHVTPNPEAMRSSSQPNDSDRRGDRPDHRGRVAPVQRRARGQHPPRTRADHDHPRALRRRPTRSRPAHPPPAHRRLLRPGGRADLRDRARDQDDHSRLRRLPRGAAARSPLVPHRRRAPARWLTIHAHDGGFAAFMRGLRDGTKIKWDISAVPADGGRPASYAIVSPNLADEHRETESQPRRLRCALPDLCVADWHLRGRQPLDLRLRDQGSRIDTYLILDGAVEATLAGATQTVGPRTLISVPHAVPHTLHRRGPGPVRILSLHTRGGPCEVTRLRLSRDAGSGGML